jgi:ferredoxin-NADP reductase
MIARVRVLSSRPLTPTTHGIRVGKPSGFEFRPVQFCGLEIATSGGSEEHPMSLASPPTRDYLEFGARISSSAWKQAFRRLRPGDEVEVDGPYGHFLLDESRDAAFVAGGIGITPLKGMAEYITDTEWTRNAALVFSNQREKEIVYRDELKVLSETNPRLHVWHTLSQEPAESAWSGRCGAIGRGGEGAT